MKNTLKIVDVMFPGCKMIFIFDNSSCHDAMAENALNVNKMNVNPGGKSPPMHDTFIPYDNPNPSLRGNPQSMQFPEDHPDPLLCGAAKGMRVILEERGLLFGKKNLAGKNIIGECKACKARKARKPHLSGPTPEELDADLGDDLDDGEDGEDDCCMKKMLSSQADFLAEKSELEKVIILIPLILLFDAHQIS